jgi:hypothetical protein
MRYELSDCEWNVIRPMLPNKLAAFPAWTTGAFSTASFGSCDQVHPGVICPELRSPYDLLQSFCSLAPGWYLGPDHGCAGRSS